MKYSIIFPYYDRLPQLKRTFISFVDKYTHRSDWEVIIVEDSKQTEQQSQELEDFLLSVKEHIPFIWIKSQAKNAYNPSQAFNEGVQVSIGDIIILSNPECSHTTDILSGLDEEFEKDPDCYVVCSCLALKEKKGENKWYQHSKYRNECYHFCSAISQANFKSIQGFDERYTQGYGYDDNSFRDKVKRAGLHFVLRDDLLVLHQWHSKVRPINYKELLYRNRRLYESESRSAAEC